VRKESGRRVKGEGGKIERKMWERRVKREQKESESRTKRE
jgi:hypothetical protein